MVGRLDHHLKGGFNEAGRDLGMEQVAHRVYKDAPWCPPPQGQVKDVWVEGDGEVNCPGFDGGLGGWVTRPPWAVRADGSTGLRVLQGEGGRARRAADADSTTGPTPGWPARPVRRCARGRVGRSARPCTGC